MSRLFVVIPAAGHSRRMGVSKLLLELGNRSVIAHLLEALLSSTAVTRIVIVVRAEDLELLKVLKSLDEDRLQLIVPDEAPAEMRQSVELALSSLRSTQEPQPEDGWALIPADHPLLSSETFEQLADLWQVCDAPILTPTVKGAGGHPTFFQWSLADEASNLASHLGLNALVHADPGRVKRVEINAEEILFDLDSPQDYERAKVWWSSRHAED